MANDLIVTFGEHGDESEWDPFPTSPRGWIHAVLPNFNFPAHLHGLVDQIADGYATAGAR